MNTVNALNIYLGNKRKYLLMTLNVVLAIFVILEIMIWNEVNGLLSAEEFAEHRIYNPGDSTKDIDWKVFARRLRIMR